MSKPYSVHRPSKNRGDAVRLFCMECCGASVDPGFECRPWKEVKECPCTDTCSLWPYRMGGAKQDIPQQAEYGGDKAPRTRREPQGRIVWVCSAGERELT